MLNIFYICSNSQIYYCNNYLLFQLCIKDGHVQIWTHTAVTNNHTRAWIDLHHNEKLLESSATK